MTRKSLCSRLKSGLEHSCWTGSPPVCERPRATKADLFRAGLQVQRASNVNRRAKRPGQSNKNPERNVDHVRSLFRKQMELEQLPGECRALFLTLEPAPRNPPGQRLGCLE